MTGLAGVTPMPIAVVVGMAAEARIARRLGWPVAVGGGTAEGVEPAARRLISEGAGALVSFGLAGGLDPSLRPGALIVPSIVIDDSHRYAADPNLSRILGGETSHALLGTSTVVASVADKQRLHRDSGAAATDMESAAVARIASQHAIPFAVLRAICDPADRALPPAALAALDARGAIAISRVLASLVSHPAQLAALFALARHAAIARSTLVARVRQIARARG
jgi:adenosylhomocysteine nucleosidase